MQIRGWDAHCSLRTLKVVRLLLRHKASSLMLTRTAFQMLRRAKATRTLTAALTTLILTPTAMASPTRGGGQRGCRRGSWVVDDKSCVRCPSLRP